MCVMDSVQVGHWKKAILDQARSLFEGKRGPQPAAEVGDADHLYSEIGRLKIELDGLKKKSGLSLPR
jgi:transposase